jgi:hypothetical protein
MFTKGTMWYSSAEDYEEMWGKKESIAASKKPKQISCVHSRK